MKMIPKIALILSTFLFCCQGRATAADIYDNIGQSILTDAGLNDASWAALSFKTTDTNYVITAVNVPLKRLNSSTTGSIILSLYTATGAGSAPETKIGSDLGSTPIAGYTQGIYQNFSITGLNVPLSPSTNYYLVISSTGLAGNYGVGVNNTGGGTVTGSLGYSDTLNSGGSWSGPTSGYYFIGSVTATVPEPTTYALGVIASGLMGIVAGRRKARRA